ncbi:DUF4013 domain-containing protein [uncultured Methanoregula sp.]|uniref:DUF4013 domain-containing protein n=1 Tax=uncultured Methanoregula sp. TaxID=1005933 RepID=UPI002AAC0B78|nr:DUF4013 domain-containing protein [uncultured Methanoregula sp.]
MDFGKMVGESFGYAKEGLVGKWMKWILLLIATIILMLPLMGYALRVYRGEKPAPEVDKWGTLFIDGIKYLIICLIYAIPLFIVLFLALAPMVTEVMAAGGDPAAVSAALAASIGTFLVGLIILVILAIIIGMFSSIGMVRFARTGSMGEAFNFGAISATIGKIGWVSFIIALIIMGIIMGIIELICMLIPFVGQIISFILIPFITIVEARYICLIYDSAGTA